MLPGIELMGCQDLAVPAEVMQHVVQVESSSNPYAIGVVGGRLVRQPRSLAEALATVRMLEEKGYNFSVGLAQVNRHNLARQGLSDYAQAFQACPNIQAGARILAECHQRAGGDWGKAFSCYYSGNFVTGYRHGYVQKVLDSMAKAGRTALAAITVDGIPRPAATSWTQRIEATAADLLARRGDAGPPQVPQMDLARAAESALGTMAVALPAPAAAPPSRQSSAPVRVNLVDAAPVAALVSAFAPERLADSAAPPAGGSPAFPDQVAPSADGRDAAFVF